MKSPIEELLKSYNVSTIEETKAALREIVQSIVLLGLSRSNFFKFASFYGGTALRIIYGLNRYSEDLDFTLNEVNHDFSLIPFINTIIEVGKSYGLELEVNTKVKAINSPIESAFAKLNTFQTLINLKINNDSVKTLQKNEVIKVKFEIDCNPASGFTVNNTWIDTPEFSPIIVLDEPSLFAGKIHALLCRTYKNNVKGRDYYDFVFFMSKKIKPNLNYLRNKLLETGKISSDKIDLDEIKKMLIDKFESVDFNMVRKDASKFLFRNENLDYYTKEFFIHLVNRL